MINAIVIILSSTAVVVIAIRSFVEGRFYNPLIWTPKYVKGKHFKFEYEKPFEQYAPSNMELYIMFRDSREDKGDTFRYFQTRHGAKSLCRRIDEWIDAMPAHEKIFLGLE